VYSELLWEHYQSPCNNFRLEDFQHWGRRVNPICPDVVELFATSTGSQIIQEMTFVAEACPPVIATASMLCQWAAGKTLQQLAQLTEQDLAQWVGPLPPNKRHAVQLTFLALQELLGPRPFNPAVESV
jgi:NifU-like protein involved in Fe-S cluster formation